MIRSKRLLGFICICFIMLFSISFLVSAQDCEDCFSRQVGENIYVHKIPVKEPTNNQELLNHSKVRVSSADNEKHAEFGGMWRVLPSKEHITVDKDNPVIYTSDESFNFHVLAYNPTEGDFWHEEIEFPDKSKVVSEGIYWRNNRWYYKDGSVFPGDGWYFSFNTRCKPEGEWKATIFFNGSPAVTKTITAKPGADPNVVKHGEYFRQGHYNE